MSKKLYEENNIRDIADAIREQNGTQNSYTVAQMGNAVRAIETEPDLEALNVTENGDYLPSAQKDGFSSVHVAVPTSSEPVLQEKTITENGVVLPDTGYDGLSKVTVIVEDGDPVSTDSFWDQHYTMDSISLENHRWTDLISDRHITSLPSTAEITNSGLLIHTGSSFNLPLIKSLCTFRIVCTIPETSIPSSWSPSSYEGPNFFNPGRIIGRDLSYYPIDWVMDINTNGKLCFGAGRHASKSSNILVANNQEHTIELSICCSYNSKANLVARVDGQFVDYLSNISLSDSAEYNLSTPQILFGSMDVFVKEIAVRYLYF